MSAAPLSTSKNTRPKWKQESGRLTAWRTTLGEHIEKKADGYYGNDCRGAEYGPVATLIEITTMIEACRP